MNKTIYWTEGVLSILFLASLGFAIFNEDYLHYYIPKEFTGYFFWLSLGLLAGFHIYKYEFKLWLREQKENKHKERKMPTGHSPN